MIRFLMVNKTVNLMVCYEQLVYLKKKLIVKTLILKKFLVQKKYLNNILNNITVEVKNKNNIDNKKEINNIKKVSYVLFLLLNKITKK